MTSKLGIHLPNSNISEASFEEMMSIGAGCYLALDLQAGLAERVRARQPEALIVFRLYDADVMARDAAETAQEHAAFAEAHRHITEHYCPANELNLSVEHERSGEEQAFWESLEGYRRINAWLAAYAREFRRLCPWAKLHFPAFSPGHSEDQPDHGFVGMEVCREAIALCDVFDDHCYWEPPHHRPPARWDDPWYGRRYRLKLRQLSRLGLGHLPVFISEFNRVWRHDDPDDGEAYAQEALAWIREIEGEPRVLGACHFIWDSDDPRFADLALVGQPAVGVFRAYTAEESHRDDFLASGAADLRGSLPVRVGAPPYESGAAADIDTLAVHYVGDPNPEGSEAGYGAVSPDQVARFQTGPHAGLRYPSIAYTWVIDSTGRLFQCHPLSTVTWQVEAHNRHSRGVLLTGFGRRGTPNRAQRERLLRLHTDLEQHLDRRLALLGHQELGVATLCPGEGCLEWLRAARADAEARKRAAPVGFEVRPDGSWYCRLTQAEVAGVAQRFYQQHDGLFWLGYPRTPGWTQEGGRWVKYFQRARLESTGHPSQARIEDLQLGLLGDELLHLRGLL